MSHEDGDVVNDEATPGIDRRSILRKAAVGTAAAWVAPQIITATAAGAQSGGCVPDGLAWADFDIDVDALPSSAFDAPIAGSGVVNVAFSDAGTGGGTGTAAYASVAPLGGEFSSFVTLELDASAPGEFVELTLTFSSPVEDLAFTILDLDLGLGFWQDRIELQASLAGSPVLLGAGDASYDPIVITEALAPPVNRFTAVVDPSGVGDGTDNGSSDANVAVVYPSAVDTVVIRYLAGPDEAAPQPQQIGIGDLTFCTFI